MFRSLERRPDVTDDFREMLLKNLATEEAQKQRAEVKIRALRSALNEYDRESEDLAVPEPLIRSADNRFQGVRPVWKAIKAAMQENSLRMSKDELEAVLLAGGAMIGKPRSGNLRISIEDAIESGKLKQEGDKLVWIG
jgi:hypothetical protein